MVFPGQPPERLPDLVGRDVERPELGVDAELPDAAGDQLRVLGAEVEALKLESLRFPWEEGLPEQIRASLEPYRDRLAATYDPLTSVIEMGLTDEN